MASGFEPEAGALAARARFTELVGRDDADIDLGEAALWIAAEARSGLDVGAYLEKLDRTAEAVGSLTGSLEQQVETLNRQLFGTFGYHGARDDYYDARNSFLDQVLDRKMGIPITLSVVYIEVAKRLGLDASGINFPGHFLTRVGDAPIVVDAFEGRVATPDECETRLTAAIGANHEPLPNFLRPAGNKPILLRMLSNLKSIYASRRDFESALGCCDRSLLLFPDSPTELRDRGLMYHGLDCPRPALTDLERYLELDPRGEGTDAVRQLVQRLRATLPSVH